ncbi:pirin family protein [Basilea psittacipulmonis]|uniref:Quercetin 2,3-dioxygenase n=1 Tax=Basilea psittacipulmonis DSM 24701 TaxID=1072685 RepID=A0A077DHZ4_9BURK|nr:pirin family protein [Basilea psittacipulmonis]AIL32728.1 quercetin 2,3-dioxygenase [Basilea psittacipulmonis DSM 24701]
MITIRKSEQRGQGQLEWLTSFHSFSFAQYYDPQHMHFSHLRVINEDFIAPTKGFGMHPHQDMEILTYVLQGSVAHQDSMGNRTQVKAGEFQIMSAGSGIFHSEINPSLDETLHLYQIWIIPNQKGITPRYAQGKFADKQGASLILSPQAEQGSFKIYQNMRLWRYQYPASQNISLNLDKNRRYWLQLIKGKLLLNGEYLASGDAVAITQESDLTLQTEADTEFLLFDLV